MKFVQAVKSYKGAVEGWTTRGTIFNVGKEHKPGLRTVTEQRAKQMLQAGLAVEYVEGDAQMKPDANDPVVVKGAALRQREQEAALAARSNARADSRRRTKVDPPPSNKGASSKNPPTPRRAADVPRQSPPALTSEKSTAGGPTGPAQDSSSSSPADPPANESTGRRRGLRRGDSEAQKRLRGGSRSTKPGDSSPTPTRSTAPTSNGGNTAKASPDSPG